MPGQSHCKTAPLSRALVSPRAGETKLWARCGQEDRPRKVKIPNREQAAWGEPSFSTTFPLVVVCSGCRNRMPQTGRLHNRHLFSHSSGDSESRVKVLTGLVSGADSCFFLAADSHLSLCPHMAFLLCVWGEWVSSGSPLFQRTPVTSFNVNYLLKGPVCK